ncbi:MAG: Acetyltransferase [Chloroflexi bacterium]|nr:Acetyltransferase [Chloroflexota bacterium]
MISTTVTTYRPFAATDAPEAFAVFRRSLFDYLHRIGMVDAETAANPPIETAWASQGPWIEHLAATAAENWIAEDDVGRVIGWALSVERDGALELTHFFVEPGTQARGIGRGLLERAFPIGRGKHRVIMATQDPRALALYLRFGVNYITTSMDMVRRPRALEMNSGITFERLTPGDESVRAVGDIEAAILGHRREADVRFLLGNRAGWLARRDGSVIGFAFGANGSNSGPIASLDPSDIPPLLDHVENEAAAAGLEEVYFAVPMMNDVAVRHLLAGGFQIEPFYVKVLADSRSMQLDRWVHTGPAFII